MMAPERPELPRGWVWTTLGEVGVVSSGGTPSTADPANFDGDIPWLTPADLSAFHGKVVFGGRRTLSQKGLNQSSAKLLPAGTILFSSRAPVGYVAIAGKALATNQGFKNLTPHGGVYNEFVFYYLKANRKLAENWASGTTFLELSASRFAQLPMPLPPTAEQRRIVAKIEELFTQLDAGVEALRQAQAQLKRYRQAVLKAAFEGRLTEEWRRAHPLESASTLLGQSGQQRWRPAAPAEGGAGGYDGAGGEVALVSQTRLPALPPGWGWIPFGRLLSELRNGFFAGAPADEPPGMPILRISAVRPLQVNLESPRYVRDVAAKASHYLLKDGDLLFTRYNGSLEFVGACGMVRGLRRPMIYPDKLIRARLLEGVLPDYIELYFAAAVPRGIIEKKAKSTAGQHGIAGSELRSVPVALAPPAEQDQVVSRAQALLSVADQVEAAIEQGLKRAERLRQAILKRAFEGKLVPQDPSDEPAEVLLERIRAERYARSATSTKGREGREKGARGRRRASTEARQERLL